MIDTKKRGVFSYSTNASDGTLVRVLIDGYQFEKDEFIAAVIFQNNYLIQQNLNAKIFDDHFDPSPLEPGTVRDTSLFGSIFGPSRRRI